MCTGDFQGRTGWWLQSKNSRVRMHSPRLQVIGSFMQTGSTWESPSSLLLYGKAAFSFNINSDQPYKGCQSYIIQNMYNCKHNITTSRKIKHTFQYDTKTCISTSLRDQHRWNSMIKVTSWQYRSWTEICNTISLIGRSWSSYSLNKNLTQKMLFWTRTVESLRQCNLPYILHSIYQ